MATDTETNSRLLTVSDHAVNSYRYNIHDEISRIAIVGDSQVGKSSLLHKFSGRNDSKYTIGVDFQFINVVLEDHEVKLLVWDISGHKRFEDIAISYYQSASGFLLVFDITNKESFLSLRKRMQLIKDHCKEFAEVILVGTKRDLEKKREVSQERAQIMADEWGLEYFEVSSVNGYNVDHVFKMLY